MRTIQFYIFLVAAVVLSVVASCSKPDVVEPGDKNPGQEPPDTTEKVDTVVKPEEPAVPEGAFLIQTSFSVDNTPEEGWKTSWTEGDAVNVFSIQGTKPEADDKLWTNHGRFVFNPAIENTLVGDLVGEFIPDQKYLMHAVYPYSEEFVDPSVIDDYWGAEEQVLLIGHLPGGYLVQKGYGNTDHLSGPHMPLYGAAYTEGNETPQFRMHQMATVINVRVTNSTSTPITVSEVKVQCPQGNLVGRFAVDFSKVTSFGHGCIYLDRHPIETSNQVILKVEDAGELPVGETADFYLPIIPDYYVENNQFIITVGDYVEVIDLTSKIQISSGRMKTFDVEVADPERIELIAPAEDATLDLAALEKVVFSWNKCGDNEKYSILFSTSDKMVDFKKIDVTGTSIWMRSDYFDDFVFLLGLESAESGKIYWSVVLSDDTRPTVVNSLNVKRLPKVSNEERIAESLTIPVAILIEDPVYYGRIEEYKGKRLTEIPHKAWGRRWNDPKVQMLEYERDMEASSHGVVQYEVVEIVEADRMFSYHRESAGSEYEYVTVDTLVNYYFMENPDDESGVKLIDNMASYDYVGMMQYYGFDKRVDAGEIKEVWVYTHPASGMNESRLIGDNAFWCNSRGIGKGEATNSELCCVMFCNYERTTDLAMHSFGHRFESIMSQVYARKGGYPSTAWKYDEKFDVEELTNWEKYSAHSLEYEKYKNGYAHIGMCHFPPNAESDYNYGNPRYVMTYADTWFDYPNIREDDSVARRVNKSEWNDAGGDQWGYMKWYFEHIPHFKGLCPRDNYLNNWWYYLVDYDNAMIYEEQLRNECIKK